MDMQIVVNMSAAQAILNIIVLFYYLSSFRASRLFTEKMYRKKLMTITIKSAQNGVQGHRNL